MPAIIIKTVRASSRAILVNPAIIAASPVVLSRVNRGEFEGDAVVVSGADRGDFEGDAVVVSGADRGEFEGEW